MSSSFEHFLPSSTSLCAFALPATERRLNQMMMLAQGRDRLEAAASLKDLAALPGNRLEGLKGNRHGQYSIRVNDQWRICFEWPESSSGPINVEIVDYH